MNCWIRVPDQRTGGTRGAFRFHPRFSDGEYPAGIQKHLPAFGVYLSRTVIDGASYGSITNIGKKPTIAGERPAGAETYIYDLDENLYGKKIEVHFLDFMRPEMKFSGVDELKMQVLKDKETGRKMHGAER